LGVLTHWSPASSQVSSVQPTPSEQSIGAPGWQSGLVAGVVGAADAVGAVDRRARPAVECGVADLGAVAEGAVVAERRVGRVDALVADLVAGVVGAADAVGAVDRRARLTVERGIADLGAVAEGAVVAERRIGCLDALVADLVARVVSAADPVGAVDRAAWLAVEGGVTDLGAIAEGPVAADTVIGDVRALIGRLEAGVVGAGHAVRAVDGRARLAVERGIAGLDPVAEGTVVAKGLVGRMHALVADLVAGVVGAADAVGAVAGQGGLTVERGIADLGAVAEDAVVA
jgi:hypothetical protein